MNQNKKTIKKRPYKGPKRTPKDRDDCTPTKGKFSQDTQDTTHSYNDVSWYAKNAQMLTDAASFSYNTPLGTFIKGADVFGGAVNTNSGFNVPGLMTLELVPTIGISKDSASPANLAAQNIYSFVRYRNSGAKNYDQADLFLYLLAMDSIYSFWNWCKRAYGLLNTYSQKNKYMPRSYFIAMGLDFDDFIANIADFRLWLNQAAAEISAFCVPAVMPYFIRHSWLYSNVYKDSDSDKAQQYMFNPACFYLYDETGSQYGGRLVPQWINTFSGISTITTASLKLSELQAYYRNLISAIAYSEDIGVMSGDILKAYEQGNLFKLEPVMPDYTVLPVYNEEVLNQIHNSTLHRIAHGNKIDDLTTDQVQQVNDSFMITQDPNTGFLKYDPILKQSYFPQKKAFINMPWDNVTPANTMVGTRLTDLVRNTDDIKTTLFQSTKFNSLGSDFVSGRYVLSIGLTGAYGISDLNPSYSFAGGAAAVSLHIKHLVQISQFDWHPLVPIFSKDSGDNYTCQGFLGDVNNFTYMDEYSLDQLHTTAIMSLFNVPQIGSY